MVIVLFYPPPMENGGISYVDLDFGAAILSAFDKLNGVGHGDIGLVTFPCTIS